MLSHSLVIGFFPSIRLLLVTPLPPSTFPCTPSAMSRRRTPVEFSADLHPSLPLLTPQYCAVPQCTLLYSSPRLYGGPKYAPPVALSHPQHRDCEHCAPALGRILRCKKQVKGLRPLNYPTRQYSLSPHKPCYVAASSSRWALCPTGLYASRGSQPVVNVQFNFHIAADSIPLIRKVSIV